MLNIGRVGADAVSYYVDSVAPTAADYYFGRGESAGRWMGSLAIELGLTRSVEREQFERLLGGLHPGTGQELVTAAGSNARSKARSARRASPVHPGAQALDVAQVAAQLQVSTRAVRHWLQAGEAVKLLVSERLPGETDVTAELAQCLLDPLAGTGIGGDDLPRSYLLGERVEVGGKGGHRYRWAVSQASVDRLREQRRPPSARAGWDLVFRPPKSYSVLWAVGPEHLSTEIRDIHHQAVADALGYLELSAGRGRTTAEVGKFRKRVRAASGGFVIAAFDHRDSRAGDPLLHTHCVVANATRLDDGHWSALDPQGLYRHGLAADAIYQATFRHLAEHRLGLASETVVNGWADVVGVPRSVVEHFSKRSEEIAAELARIGSDSAAARQVAAVATRRTKASRRGTEGLHARWRVEAAAVGFGAEEVSACLGRAGPSTVEPGRIEAMFDRLAGDHGLTETAATFTRADVVAALAGVVGGSLRGPAVVDLADRFLASHRAVAVRERRAGLPRDRLLDARHRVFVDDLANSRFTTPDLAAIESRLMAVADATTGGHGRAQPAAVASVLATRSELSAEQESMVRSVCLSDSFMRPVVGYPGSGKTYATSACVAAFRASGVEVIGCAVTAEAADELSRATGLGPSCDTIARTLLDLDHAEFGGLEPGTVVIVDEASTVGHRDLDRLSRHAEAAGGCLVLVGDPRQHGPVGPGHFFSWLVSREHPAAVILRDNHRQRDLTDERGEVRVSLAEERAANQEFREGRIAEALSRRDDAGLVTRAATAQDLHAAMAADWFAGWQAGDVDPMITTRNSVRRQLNLQARQLLDGAGALSGPSLSVSGSDFQSGDRVVARENDRRLRSSADPSWWVKNGSRGGVTAVHLEEREVTVAFEGHGGLVHSVRLPASYLKAGHLEWGYAVTDYGVQGRTMQRGRALVDDTTSAAGAYVATTRGRLENRIYLVDGKVPDDQSSETSHGPPAQYDTNLDAVATRMAAEPSPTLLHTMDPHVRAADALALTHTLAQLDAELQRVAEILAGAPPDVSRRIAGAESSIEEIGARRQLLLTRLVGLNGEDGSPPTRSAGDRLRERLGRLEASQGALARTLDQLGDQAALRTSFLADHDAEIARRDLLREAISVREAKVRLAAASLHPDLRPLASSGPAMAGFCDGQRRWTKIVEGVALYRDRWEDATTVAGSPDLVADPGTPLGILGDRPCDSVAAREWDEIASAIAEVSEPDARHEAAPELSLLS